MRYLFALLMPALLLTLSGCSASSGISQEAPHASTQLVAPNETILLVSLEDGTVVRQTIASDADLCFKQNSVSSTICLTQGPAIIDPYTNAIVGFEMIEARIELVAASD